MRVAALIPAFNEEYWIAETLQAASALQTVDEIVVVDDGSVDGTKAAVEECRSRVPGRIRLVELPVNQGKGAALNAGLSAAQADVYLLLDADLGVTASYGAELLAPVLTGEAHMAVARFTGDQAPGGRMGFGLVRRVAVCGVKLLTGCAVTSPLSGQRAVLAEVLERLGGFAEGFGAEVSLTVGALHHGFTVVEVPLPMRHRAYGRGLRGICHRSRQLFHVLLALRGCWRRGWHR